LIEEDVHYPFGGLAVPFLRDGTGASVAVENRVRFVQDAVWVGSDQHAAARH
jgi:hypothetical protein